MKAVTAQGMRGLEARAAAFGLSSAVLMHLAGLAVAEEVARGAGGARCRRVLVLVGPGNNGGDGLVAAFHLHDWGAKVFLYHWNRKLEGDVNYALCVERKIESVDAASDPGFEKLGRLLEGADIVVDALLGIGISRPIAGSLEGILRRVEEIRRGRPLSNAELPRPYLVALDVPTGLNSDTGEADPSCFGADLTVTLGFPKVGLFLFPGAARVGKLVTRGIGIHSGLAEDFPDQVMSGEYIAGLLPTRPPDAHKGTFGKVLVVGGSTRYIGAPALSALAALRAGAGLVTLAIARSLHPIIAAKVTEPTFLPLPEVEEGALGLAAVEPVVEALCDYEALLIGPGLGRHPETAGFVEAVLKSLPSGVKAVVDADALNALAGVERWWEGMTAETVLTPHPGEMGRLTGKSIVEVNAARLDISRAAATAWGKVVVLKGAYTLVAGPGGCININPSANPALASAGTGDVLSGVVAGLLAQGAQAFAGASAGVFVHSEAAASLKGEVDGAGLLASDLLDAIPGALKSIRQCSGLP